MTLPLSRNTTYAASAQVKSADLNDIQDQIIGGLHGSLEQTYGLEDAFLIVSGTFTLTSSGPQADGIGDQLQKTVDLQVGAVVTKIETYLFQAGATVSPWEFGYWQKADATFTSLETEAGTAATGHKSLPKAVNHTIAADRNYVIRMTSGQASDKFKFFAFTFGKTT